MPRFSLKRKQTKFVFDLDDTLYREQDYVRSALLFAGGLIDDLFNRRYSATLLLKALDESQPNPLNKLWADTKLPISALASVIGAMQAHKPNITLRPGAVDILNRLRESRLGFAIVTDGRSITQRAKLSVLQCFDADFISISEEVGLAKTDLARFQEIERRFPEMNYCYVADNPTKDFIAPNRLGWNTVMLLDDGSHVHPQRTNYGNDFGPASTIVSLSELVRLIE
jgi:putative hydrolase of the HAD superfamily